MGQNYDWMMIAIILAALFIVIAMGFLTSRRRRSMRLRQRFGPEYDRLLRQEGDTRTAEGVLEIRELRREFIDIRPLSTADRSNFALRWEEVQSRFVEDPRGAVTVAGALVIDLMQARGYPTGGF